ncbi:MAG: YggT family protein [Rubrobacteraceae bacterium]
MTFAPFQIALLQTLGFGLGGILAAVVNYGYYILLAFIIAWVLIGWFPAYPSSGFLQALYDLVGRVVNPILRPIRSVLPPLNLGGMSLDLSPIVAIFALSIARGLLLLLIAGFVVPIAG